MQLPIRPLPRGPHKVQFSGNGCAVLFVNEGGALRRYFLEEFPNAWHPHPMPSADGSAQ